MQLAEQRNQEPAGQRTGPELRWSVWSLWDERPFTQNQHAFCETHATSFSTRDASSLHPWRKIPAFEMPGILNISNVVSSCESPCWNLLHHEDTMHTVKETASTAHPHTSRAESNGPIRPRLAQRCKYVTMPPHLLLLGCLFILFGSIFALNSLRQKKIRRCALPEGKTSTLGFGSTRLEILSTVLQRDPTAAQLGTRRCRRWFFSSLLLGRDVAAQ